MADESIPSTDQLAHEVHSQGKHIVLAVTGGGSGAISALCGVAGASRSILAAVVPYAPDALIEWIGGKPDEFCSGATARAMSMAAYGKARAYHPAGEVLGISCTASLASDRPKHGAHRAHLACQSAQATVAWSVELEKGRRSRSAEEAIVTAVLLNLVAEAAGARARMSLPLCSTETIQVTRVDATQEQRRLLEGSVRAIPLLAARAADRPAVVFCGAFHPLHRGHRRMAEIAADFLRQPVAYELSIANVDKPPLDFIDIDQRVRQFSDNDAMWLTRAANFTDKAELFPGATFVVGADTIARIGQARYYGGQPTVMEADIARIAAAGCGFLVFGRLVGDEFCSLANLDLPASLARLCREVPPSTFRDDISSTQLRAKSGRASL